jgi:DNA-binding transcriptional MerR regulator
MAEVSRLSGVSDQAIRFYERKGLIQPLRRTSKGHRVYSSETVQSIHLIKTAQSMGFSLDEIQNLLRADPAAPPSCGDLQDLLAEKLRHVQDMGRALAQIEARLRTMLDCCTTCEGIPCPLRGDFDTHSGILGPRRCICLGGEPAVGRGLESEKTRFAS